MKNELLDKNIFLFSAKCSLAAMLKENLEIELSVNARDYMTEKEFEEFTRHLNKCVLLVIEGISRMAPEVFDVNKKERYKK